MAADIDQLLLDGCWLSDAVNRIAGAHNRNIAQARSKVLGHINWLRGQGVIVEQQGRRGRDVHYQVVPRDRADSLSIDLPPARPRRERVIVERIIPAGTVHTDADFLAAVLWLKQRWLQFNRPRVQQVAEEEFTLF